MKKELVILSGFLGSGKTTLLKSLIASHADRKLAVVLNDFGKVPVDGKLLAKAGIKKQLIEISGGSVFCSCLSASLVQTLTRLSSTDMELILLEASGMSDPSAIDKMLRLAGLDRFYDHTASICLFDPVKSLKYSHVLEVISRQLHSASVVILTKTDLYSRQEVDAAREYIAKQAPGLPVIESRHGQLQDELPAMSPARSFAFGLNTPQNRPDCLQIENIACPLADFLPWLKQEDVLRVKGYVHATDGYWFISDTGQDLQVIACTGAPTPLTVIMMQGSSDKLHNALIEHQIL